MIDSVDVAGNRLTWQCEECKRDNTTQVSTLRVGNVDSPDVIPLPSCTCGAQEWILRTWDSEADLPHRRAINALAEHLQDTGRCHASLSRAADRERPPLLIGLGTKIDDLTRRKARALRGP